MKKTECAILFSEMRGQCFAENSVVEWGGGVEKEKVKFESGNSLRNEGFAAYAEGKI